MAKKKTLLQEKLIVCLWGAAKHGKSSTLKHFAEMLIPVPSAQNITWHLYHPKNTAISKMPSKISTWKNDICVSFDYKKKHIGISSGGDAPSHTKKYLEILGKENCTIIFSSIRTLAENTTEVVNFAKRYAYKIIWAHTYTPDINNKDLNEIVNIMQAKQFMDFL